MSETKSHTLLVQAAKNGAVDGVRRLHEKIKIPPDDLNEAFIQAETYGQLECLDVLKSKIDLTIQDRAIGAAAANNHAQCLRYLMNPQPNSNGVYGALPERGYTLPLLIAAKHGHVECMNVLLPVSDPQYFWLVLNEAAKQGCVHGVELLLAQKCIEYTDMETPLLCAAVYSHLNCVDALYPLADVQKTLENLNLYYSSCKNQWRFLEERYYAEQQKIVLNACIETPSTTTRVSKL